MKLKERRENMATISTSASTSSSTSTSTTTNTSSNTTSSSSSSSSSNTSGILKDHFSNFSTKITDTMSNSIKANGLYQATNEDLYQKFKRVATLDPYRRLNYTKEYLFFTKPNLQILNGTSGNLTDECSNVPLFKYVNTYYPYVLKQLQYEADSTKRPFMNLLSNLVSSSLELPAITTQNDFESPRNIHGTVLTYRNTSYAADDGYEFSLEFHDSKYLELYMLLKVFDEYENRKTYGQITVPHTYVEQKIIHDQFSIYKFILDEDFRTIIYWAKVTGVYPKSVPRDTFSDLQENGGITYSVNFKGTFVEDMTIDILSDFNTVVSTGYSGQSSDLSLWDSSLNTVNHDWGNIPYVQFQSSSSKSGSSSVPERPKLLWR